MLDSLSRVVLGVVVCASVGCAGATPTGEPGKVAPAQPQPIPAGESSPEQKKDAPKLPNPDFKISAVEIIKAFSADEEAAKEKYRGKLVRISGKIVELKKENFTIHLEGHEKMNVVAWMGFDNYMLPAKVKKVGDQITLQGTSSTLYRNGDLEVTTAVMVPE